MGADEPPHIIGTQMPALGGVLFWGVRAGGTLDLAALTPEEFLTDRHGVLPFAMTNAIYIDVDHDGAWRP
jgi:hypothetical protein